MQKFVEALCQRTGLERLDRISSIHSRTSKLGIEKPSHIIAALLGFWALHLISEYGTMWVAFAVGFLYPAYVTFKLVGENTDEKDEESTFWLKYWLVYGIFYVIETVLIEALRMIPHYYLLKIAMLAWLIHPETQGASVIYEKIVRAVLKKCEGKIDEKAEKLKKMLDYKDFVKNTVVPLTKEAAKKTMQVTSGALISLMSSSTLPSTRNSPRDSVKEEVEVQ